MVDWNRGGNGADDAEPIEEGEYVDLPDTGRDARWFRIHVDEPGSVLVPTDSCLPDGIEFDLYQRRGETIRRIGQWTYYDSDLPVLSVEGWYYIKIDLHGDDRDSYNEHISFGIGDPEPNAYDVSTFRGRPSTVLVGEKVTFVVNVSKDETVSGFSGIESYWGPFTDTVIVVLYINGNRTVTFDEITLDAGESKQVELTHEFERIHLGTNEVTVRVRPEWAPLEVRQATAYTYEVTTVRVSGDTDDDELVDARETELGTNKSDPDTDGDGLEDGYEFDGDTDPLNPDTDGDSLSDRQEVEDLPTDPTVADTDADGLSDDREVEELGSDPTAVHTDADGLSDDREVDDIGSDPTAVHTDADGLPDDREVEDLGSDPTTADSDGDGLDDDLEVNDLPTDPLVADTDDDGLSDGREVNDLSTDPLDSDTDDDGLSDGREVENLGSDPRAVHSDTDELDDRREVEDLGADPTLADTDADGLDDDAEVGSLPTSPTDPDTDGDGLDDGPEVRGPTDPLVADTDGDGLDDGPEVRGGFDPLSRHSDRDLLADGRDPAPARWLFPLGVIYGVVSFLAWGVLFPARW